MKNKSVHDMLMLLADTEKAGLHKDRLHRVIEDTLCLSEEMNELLDDELEFVAAAGKREELDDWDDWEPFGGKKK